MLRCRTDRHRLSFAIPLCVLRSRGRSPSDFDAVGVRITNPLDLPQVLFVNPHSRDVTGLQHTHRIRDSLGFRPIDPIVQDRLQ